MIIGAQRIAIKILLALSLLFSIEVSASNTIRSKIHEAEVMNGIPSGLLLAIAKIETGLTNWAMNIDGISVFVKNKKQAITVLKTVASTHRYGVQGKKNGVIFAGFYQSEREAINRSQQLKHKKQLVRVRNKDYTKVNPIYTDVCVMQINYRYHGSDNFKNVDEMFDLDKCIQYAAGFLSKLINTHGIKEGIGCYNGCSTKSVSYTHLTLPTIRLV